MDTLNQRVNTLLNVDADLVKACALLIADSAARMTQLQLGAAERAWSGSAHRYRELLAASDPATAAKLWPGTLEIPLREAQRAAGEALEHALGFQRDFLRLVGEHLPRLNRRFLALAEAVPVAPPDPAPPDARAAEQRGEAAAVLGDPA